MTKCPISFLSKIVKDCYLQECNLYNPERNECSIRTSLLCHKTLDTAISNLLNATERLEKEIDETEED